MAEVRIGISGWRYQPWRGTFYPQGLVQRRELEYAAQRMNSVEINGSFYSLQRPSSYRQWAEQTPDDFVFSVKGSRFITHMKRLKNIEEPLATFFASGVLALGPKLGPVLWQLPPKMIFDADTIGRFLQILPVTTGQAAELATHHHDRLTDDQVVTRTDADRPIRHALEIRNHSFLVPGFIELLREHNVALVVADTAHIFPFVDDVTADFVYARLHGEEKLYTSGYDAPALDRWEERITRWRTGRLRRTPDTVATLPSSRAGRDVYVYFDNDVKVRAPFDAMTLAARFT